MKVCEARRHALSSDEQIITYLNKVGGDWSTADPDGGADTFFTRYYTSYNYWTVALDPPQSKDGKWIIQARKKSDGKVRSLDKSNTQLDILVVDLFVELLNMDIERYGVVDLHEYDEDDEDSADEAGNCAESGESSVYAVNPT